MRALHHLGPGELSWRDVAPPAIERGREALVEPVAVATCDLDALIVAGRTPFPAPFVLGHEGVGRVLEVGDEVSVARPGDLVLIPYQISCGTCEACAAGRTAHCGSLSLAQTYGFGLDEASLRWGGFLSDVVRVPYADAMLMPLPPGLPAEAAASVSDNLTDAYRTVAGPRARRPGEAVLVVGGGGSGSIGLYCVAAAVALGASEVVYVDPDAARRETAIGLGARVLGEVPDRLDDRYPIVAETSGTRAGLALALGSLGRDGVCTSAAVHFDPATVPAFPLLPMYMLGATFTTGRVHARTEAPAVLELLAAGRLDVASVTSRVVPFADAAEALLEPHTKLVFAR